MNFISRYGYTIVSHLRPMWINFITVYLLRLYVYIKLYKNIESNVQ